MSPWIHREGLCPPNTDPPTQPTHTHTLVTTKTLPPCCGPNATYRQLRRDFLGHRVPLHEPRVRQPLHSAPTGMWKCPDFFVFIVGGLQTDFTHMWSLLRGSTIFYKTTSTSGHIWPEQWAVLFGHGQPCWWKVPLAVQVQLRQFMCFHKLVKRHWILLVGLMSL
jgi:hypothetical protein